MNFSSKIIEEAVEQFATLPGIGKRTALRFVLHTLKNSDEEVNDFLEAIQNLKSQIKHCKKCYNISDNEICNICSNSKRNEKLICVVEDIRDVMAIESTTQFNGVYHVLGGIISPIDGIGPNDIKIQELITKLENNSGTEEVILALSTTLEGDTTNFYLFKKLQKFNIKVTVLSRGVAVGDELAYADEITLGRALLNRTPYENQMIQS